MDAMLKIDLSGSLVVVDADNIDRTPRGQKTCGVLAILASAPRMRRPRRWVQSKLWSDRGTENANASLRQSLVELRRTFGPYADAIQSDRKDIWLDEAAVRIVMPGDSDALASGDEEFLSGIDIKDEAFEDWLRDMRMSYYALQTRPITLPHSDRQEDPEVRIYFKEAALGCAAPFVVSVASQEISKYVCERSLAIMSNPNQQISASCIGIEVKCELNCLGSHSQAHFRAIRVSDGFVVCSRFGEFPVPALALLNHPEFRQMIPEFGEQIVQKLPEVRGDNTRYMGVIGQVRAGIADTFSYDFQKLNSAEAKLLDAYNRTGNPSILIWLAWQKTSQVIEETTQDKDTATELARYYCSKALEAEPHSAFANAMSSLIHMIHSDDIEASFMLAERAEGLSKFDPYVQAALATANMFAGRPKDATKSSLLGTRLAQFAGNAHWWDLSHSLACLSTGDIATSEHYALRASQTAPMFRAPKRVLLAIYASQNRIESAVDQLHALKNVEPTFTVDRFINDHDYPNTTVRNAGLLDNLKQFSG